MTRLLQVSFMASAVMGLKLSDNPSPEVKAKRASFAARGNFLWQNKGEMLNSLSGHYVTGSEVYSLANSSIMVKKVRAPSRYICKGENKTQCYFEAHKECEQLRRVNDMYSEGASPVVQCVEDHGYRREDPFILVTGGSGTVRDWVKKWYQADMPADAMWAFISQMVSNHVAIMASGHQLWDFSMVMFPDGPRFVDVDDASPATCEVARNHMFELFIFDMNDAVTSLMQEQHANEMDLEEWVRQFHTTSENDNEVVQIGNYLDEMHQNQDQCSIDTEEHLKMKKKFKSKSGAGQRLKEFQAEWAEVMKEKESYGELF